MHQRRDAVAATVVYAVATFVLTWPLARGMARDVPADFGDPLFASWILAWDADHMLQAISGHVTVLREYWNANIFHPHPLTLAYAEHLTAQAITILPVWAVTKNPILCYNLVFLSTFVLSALGMFLFVRDLTACRSAAFLAGMAYGFAPYRFGTMSHVQVLSSMWMPLALLGFHRFFETRRVASLAGGTAAWIAQNLSCGYYLLFFSPVVALYMVWEVTRRKLWTDAGTLIRLSAAGGLVALVTAPFVMPYMELRRLGVSPRSLTETDHFAADIYGYLTTDVGMRLWGGLLRGWPKPEGSLFPGFGIGGLAALAVIAQWWRARRFEPDTPANPGGALAARLLGAIVVLSSAVLVAMFLGWTLHATVIGVKLQIASLRRVFLLVVVFSVVLLLVSDRVRRTARRWCGSPVGFLSLCTIFALTMSLGPEIHSHGRLISGLNVYALFYHFVPGYDGLRVPARFAMIVAFSLAALAGHGAAVVARRRHGAVGIALATSLIIAESWAVPIRINMNATQYEQSGLMPLPDRLTWGLETPAVYRFLAQLPPSSAVIELPFGEAAFDIRYMFYSITHWRRLVNGYSGGTPDEYGLWTGLFSDALDRPERAWQAVVESRATHIVVHEASYRNDRGRRISEWARAYGAQELATLESDHVFAVSPASVTGR